MNDIPPVADKVICIDFDGTIFKWGDIYADTPPFPGVIDFMRRLKSNGWNIVIFTSRMSPTWWESEGLLPQEAFSTQMGFVKQRLEKYGIPYDRITAEKVPASYYIDDKAIRFEGLDHSWADIQRQIKLDE